MSRFATSPCSHAACHRISHPMKKLSLIAALLLGATPVAAQSVQQPLGTSGEINNSTLTNTGVICIEEMVATFCNVPTGPNLNGYGWQSGDGFVVPEGAGWERRRTDGSAGAAKVAGK